jgi:VanZ family protein
LSSERLAVSTPIENSPLASRNRIGEMLWYWGPALAWLGAIAAFSTEKFSATHTGSVLIHILNALHVHLTGAQFEFLHFLVRKSAHFIAYATLSGLFFRAWRGASHSVGWRWKWMLLALAVCLLTSSSDEIHQLFTPGRTGVAKDVLLDMTGALFTQLIIIAFISGKRRRPIVKSV